MPPLTRLAALGTLSPRPRGEGLERVSRAGNPVETRGHPFRKVLSSPVWLRPAEIADRHDVGHQGAAMPAVQQEGGRLVGDEMGFAVVPELECDLVGRAGRCRHHRARKPDLRRAVDMA